MGLDMYFEKRKHTYYLTDWNTGKRNSPNGMKEKIEVYDGGYFRKFNALHNYIVQTFAHGFDECQPIGLSEEDIKKVLGVLEEVNENPQFAGELLPTASRFFFGSLEYDDWYFEEVKNAITMFKDLLTFLNTKPRNRKGIYAYHTVVYQASW